MAIHLDEAGDIGFDFTKSGTSNFFIITLLKSNQTADKIINKAVKRTLKNKINHSKYKQHELKGTQTSEKVKNYFFEQIKDCQGWSLYASILDKKKLYTNSKLIIPKLLYDKLVMELLTCVDFNSNDSPLHITIDRWKKNQEIAVFDQNLTQHLKSYVAPHIPIYIKHQRSIDNPGLQAVDLFAWGIFRKFEIGEKSWFDTFQDKIEILKMV